MHNRPTKCMRNHRPCESKRTMLTVARAIVWHNLLPCVPLSNALGAIFSLVIRVPPLRCSATTKRLNRSIRCCATVSTICNQCPSVRDVAKSRRRSMWWVSQILTHTHFPIWCVSTSPRSSMRAIFPSTSSRWPLRSSLPDSLTPRIQVTTRPLGLSTTSRTRRTTATVNRKIRHTMLPTFLCHPVVGCNTMT
jgi:hypothetical protein